METVWEGGHLALHVPYPTYSHTRRESRAAGQAYTPTSLLSLRSYRRDLNLSLCFLSQVAIEQAGAIKPLTTLLSKGGSSLQEEAAGALMNLAAHPENKRVIAAAVRLLPAHSRGRLALTPPLPTVRVVTCYSPMRPLATGSHRVVGGDAQERRRRCRAGWACSCVRDPTARHSHVRWDS